MGNACVAYLALPPGADGRLSWAHATGDTNIFCAQFLQVQLQGLLSFAPVKAQVECSGLEAACRCCARVQQ